MIKAIKLELLKVGLGQLHKPELIRLQKAITKNPSTVLLTGDICDGDAL